MSQQPSHEPSVADGPSAFLEAVIIPRARDLGGFEVRRALPASQRQMIGPFIFFDQMGPARFAPGRGIDVRPHPHIGLATVTYLFEGAILHRDTLGNAQVIEPGDINWMTAGRGIAHSERTDPGTRARGGTLSGIQSWIALPSGAEETAPGFTHHARDALPVIADDGKTVTLLVGRLFGAQSPVETFSETIYADARLDPGARLPFPPDHEERGLYILEGTIEIAGDRFEAGRLLVLRPGEPVVIAAGTAARVLLLGGTAMDGPRHLWWNFVSSSRERIETAKADWKEGRFGRVPGDDEFIPLPD
jgi:redox-sensitive bicupin YhaK (pirin superfamily)